MSSLLLITVHTITIYTARGETMLIHISLSLFAAQNLFRASGLTRVNARIRAQFVRVRDPRIALIHGQTHESFLFCHVERTMPGCLRRKKRSFLSSRSFFLSSRVREDFSRFDISHTFHLMIPRCRMTFELRSPKRDIKLQRHITILRP